MESFGASEENNLRELCHKVFLAAFDTARKMPGLDAEMAWEGWVDYIEQTEGDIFV